MKLDKRSAPGPRRLMRRECPVKALTIDVHGVATIRNQSVLRLPASQRVLRLVVLGANLVVAAATV